MKTSDFVKRSGALGPMASKRLGLCAIIRRLLLLPLFLLPACDNKPSELENLSPAAIAHIVKGSESYEIRLSYRGKSVATWPTTRLDRKVGMVVGEKAALPKESVDGLILCGGKKISLADLRQVADGLPKGLDVVLCRPDRMNCPGTCED